MGWYPIEGRSLEEATECLQKENGYVLSRPGILDPYSIWSVTGCKSHRPGMVVLDLLGGTPRAEEEGTFDFITKPVGPSPRTFDVPDEVLIASTYEPRLHDDREYATWFAKVAFVRSIMLGDFSQGLGFHGFERKVPEVPEDLEIKLSTVFQDYHASFGRSLGRWW